MRKLLSFLFFAAVPMILLAVSPGQVWAQSGTVTDDAFISTSSTTQLVNFNGQGIALVVAGSSAIVGSVHVGTTKTFIKFQLQSSLPSTAAAANVAKATLKLFISPSCNPSGAIDIYPVTNAWTESTLSPSSPPALALTAIATAIPVGKANSFLIVDVTQLVQGWLEGSANGGLDNDGIALVADTSTTNVVFDSKESFVTSHEPRLEVVLANSGPQGPAGPQGLQGPAGPQGAAGAAGATGTAATVQVGTTMTVPAGTPASVLNGGTANAAVLNFLIPQGTIGPVGPQGPAGINNRGVWSGANGYNINDAVSDSGSYWLALAPTSANTATPNTSCQPSQSVCSADWQLLAAQGARGVAGQTGAQGPQGIQGPMGFIGPQGLPGSMPTGAALTGISNTFAASQTINGNLIVSGAGNGIQFTDGTLQTTAATSTSGGGTTCASFELSSTSPVVPPGYTALGTVNAGNVWFSMAPMPTPRSDLTATSVNGKVYAIGGFPSGMNIVEVYDPSTNSWSAAASMATARRNLAAAAVNGKIYAIGGSDTNGNYLSTMEVYNPSTNSWSTAASMSTARTQLAAAAVNGKVYAIGGFGNSGVLNTVEVYDPSTNSWSMAATMQTAQRNLAATTVNGKIYAIGGTGSANTMEVYDPTVATQVWALVTSMPTGRQNLAAATVNGKIYAIGGFDVNFNPVNTVEAYDPSSNSWSTAASIITAREGLAATDASGLIYAVGGAGSPQIVNATEQYSPPVTIYTFIKN